LILNNSAVVDAGLVTNDQKWGQSTLTATATSGNTTNTIPAAVGT
jgi:hypothetical protein